MEVFWISELQRRDCRPLLTNWLAGKGACTVSKLREFTKREVYRAVQRVLQPWREAVWRVI